ncbi:hypothetical protein E2562_034819, partial [Oryza meyeriana var. granulata]
MQRQFPTFLVQASRPPVCGSFAPRSSQLLLITLLLVIVSRPHSSEARALSDVYGDLAAAGDDGEPPQYGAGRKIFSGQNQVTPPPPAPTPAPPIGPNPTLRTAVPDRQLTTNRRYNKPDDN